MVYNLSGSGDKTLLTLTTGSNGTASGKLPINSRTGSHFWAKQVKAPAGYGIYKPSKEFEANWLQQKLLIM